MADIFNLDLGDSQHSHPQHHHQEVRRFSSQGAALKSKRCSFSYSKSLSWGSGSVDSCYGSSPRTSHSFSAAILFKDSRGIPVIQPLKSPASRSSSIDDDILSFFKCYKVYDIIPSSSKLVVLDTMLTMKKAFYAMVESGVRSCPLWRASSQTYVGLVSVDDFIKVIQKNYKGSLLEIDELDDQSLQQWLEDSNSSKNLENVSPDVSLYQAISAMISKKFHQLPIADPETGNILYILNQRQLLRFLLNFVPNLQYFDHLTTSIVEMRVGTFTDIEVTNIGSKVIDVVHKFVQHNISCLPIIDQQGKCVDIYCKYDVIQLTASDTESVLDLELTIREALDRRHQYFEGPLTCKGDDSVLHVIEKLVLHDVSQLVVTDEDDQVHGVVTITDILQYLVHVHRQGGNMSAIRRGSVSVARVRQRREDSIGEEVELEEDEESPDQFKSSCSPPRWFDV